MPKIIISYRRADSGAITGRIRDRLAQHYGEDSVFMDIDNIPFGMDFRKNIAEALAKNEILLAVIGPDWLGASPTGAARIHDETDPVRIEVETALQRGIPTIPVLVGGAGMPKPEELPDSLKSLSFHNAAEVDSGRDFHAHMDRLLRSMDVALKGKLWHRLGWKRLSRRQAGVGLASTMVLIGAGALALLTRDSGPVFIGNITYIENQYQQFGGAPPAVEVRQHIVQAIELAGQHEFDRAREAFSKVPADARVPAVWNDLGVVYEKLADQASARAAYQSALAKDPAFAQAKANLARLEKLATSVPAGKEAAKPAGAASAASARDVNLLAPEAGGLLLSAPNESWRKITSGNEDEGVQTRTGADAESDVVYAFKDKKPAQIRKLTVLIKGTDSFNPKEIEVLAGDEGPNGSFRSIGKCALVNRLLFETRYQECELAPTTARYVKLKFVSSYHFNAWANVPQIRLLGRPAP